MPAYSNGFSSTVQVACPSLWAYRAHDSRLNRDVATKVSNAQFSERFTREARAIGALNDTNSAISTTLGRIIWSRSMLKDRTCAGRWISMTRCPSSSN